MLFFDMLLKVVFAVNFVTRSGVFRFSRMLKPLCKTKNLEKISWNMVFDLWWKRSCLRSSCAPMLNYGRTRPRWPGWNCVTFTHFPCFCTFFCRFLYSRRLMHRRRTFGGRLARRSLPPRTADLLISRRWARFPYIFLFPTSFWSRNIINLW